MTHMTTSIVTPMPMSTPAHAGKRARGGGPGNRRPSDSWHAADRSVVSKKTLLHEDNLQSNGRTLLQPPCSHRDFC
jgi:hypothetical protein